jgi:hypothetical protein
VHLTAVTASRHARLTLEIAERPLDGTVVSVTDFARDLRLTGAPQDAHALRRPERQVKAGDRALAHRPTQLLPAARVTRLKQP